MIGKLSVMNFDAAVAPFLADLSSKQIVGATTPEFASLTGEELGSLTGAQACALSPALREASEIDMRACQGSRAWSHVIVKSFLQLLHESISSFSMGLR